MTTLGVTRRRLGILALGALALLTAPLGVGRLYSAYYLSLVTWVLIFALFAAALDLALGYGGLVSFGHAGFFGVGAYAAALALRHFSASFWLALAIGVLAAAALATLVGWLAIHARGVYLAMLTFAFAQLCYEVAIKWVSLTGGSDGLPGGARPQINLAGLALDLADKRHMYWVVLVLVAAGYAGARRIIDSPFGRALVAVRESEGRAAAIGIDVDRHRRIALVISGSLSGLAGVLFAIHQNFVSPELLYFALSGEVVVIALLGGLGTLYGSLVGAVIAVGIKEVLSTWTDNWLVFLGALYVLCVMCFPQGLVRLAERRAMRPRATLR
jgi:branched-chain amino acid transport system permease protein